MWFCESREHGSWLSRLIGNQAPLWSGNCNFCCLGRGWIVPGYCLFARRVIAKRNNRSSVALPQKNWNFTLKRLTEDKLLRIRVKPTWRQPEMHKEYINAKCIARSRGCTALANAKLTSALSPRNAKSLKRVLSGQAKLSLYPSDSYPIHYTAGYPIYYARLVHIYRASARRRRRIILF